MKKKLLLMAATLGVCVCTLLGCRTKPLFDAGEELSAEELAVLRASAQSKDEEKQTEVDDPVLDSQVSGETFYFVETGTVYHSERECTYLKKSDNVKQGDAAAVAAAGKTRLCSACAKNEQSTGPSNESSENTEHVEVCYYTPSGETWHLNRECSSLKNSKNVIEGTIATAMVAGKSRVCSRCGD